MEIFGVYLVNQSSGSTISLYPDKDNIIGRGIPSPTGETGKVLLPHPSISKFHARIRLASETHEWFLYDTSRHGLEVNGKHVNKQIKLKHGDKIQVGPFVLMFYEKFKADDETSEQPLPRLTEEESPIVLNILGLLLVQGVLMVTFPYIMLGLCLVVLLFSGFFMCKKKWREKTKLTYRLIFLSFCFGLIGLLLSFCSIRYGLYLQ